MSETSTFARPNYDPTYLSEIRHALQRPVTAAGDNASDELLWLIDEATAPGPKDARQYRRMAEFVRRLNAEKNYIGAILFFDDRHEANEPSLLGEYLRIQLELNELNDVANKPEFELIPVMTLETVTS